VAVGQLFGGVLVPIAAGSLADRYGLAITPWLLMSFAILALLLTLGIRETAPAKRRQTG
jgi:hypothetical protein